MAGVLLVGITPPLGNTAKAPGAADPRPIAHLLSSPPTVGLKVGASAPEFSVTNDDESIYQLLDKGSGCRPRSSSIRTGSSSSIVGAPLDEAGATAQIEAILPKGGSPATASPGLSPAP